MLNILKVFFLFILTSNLYSGVLKKSQISNLELVKEVALKFPNKNGKTFENTAMAICLTETGCGLKKVGDLSKFSTVSNASFGIMQVRLETAKFIAKKYKLKEILKMDDHKLAMTLILDDKLNISMAVLFIVWLSEVTEDDLHLWSRYNGGNKNYNYIQKVMKNLKILKNKTNLCTK